MVCDDLAHYDINGYNSYDLETTTLIMLRLCGWEYAINCAFDLQSMDRWNGSYENTQCSPHTKCLHNVSWCMPIT